MREQTRTTLVRLALALAAVGLALGAFTLVGLLGTPESVGDVGAVERSLASTSTSTTSPTTTVQEQEAPEPLWSANPKAPLEAGEEVVPVGLRIERLGIDAPVGGYGVDSRGRMDVPDNVTEVGWYKFGPTPGEEGSSVLAAHVDLSGPGRGLFWDLDELEPGDRVEVTMSDDTVSEFEVVGRSTYLKSELPLDTIFSREGDPVLTLVTCGGGFSRSARSYDSNVVVYAVPVGASDAGAPVA